MKNYITAAFTILIAATISLPLLSFNSLTVSPESPPRWEKLGQRKVNFRVDKDEIIVGRIEGFFDALQVKVKKGHINMHRMVVHFRSGQSTEIEMKNNFSAGSESRVIDLPGNNRVISHVAFWYDTKGFSNSKAVVEL